MTYNPNVPSSVATNSPDHNSSGSTLSQLTPVKITNTGDLGTVDVSVESDVQAIAGIAGADIANGSSGSVISSGRILNISTSEAFGAQLYISKTGGVTSIQPSIGVNGFLMNDFVVSLGVVAKNAVNPSNKDLIVRILLVGQL